MKRFSAIAWMFLFAGGALQAQTTGGLGSLGGGATGGSSGSSGGSSSSSVGGSSASSNFAPGSGLGSTAGTGGASGFNRGSASGSTLQYPTTGNPYLNTFGNVYGMGMTSATHSSYGSNVPTAQFGQPLYALTTTSNTGLTSATAATGNAGTGFNTLGMRKAPQYVTTLADDFPLVRHSPEQIERNLRGVLERSTTLKSRDTIAVGMEGPVVVLSGTASTAHDRRLAESLIRLTPGVRELRNEIEVVPAQ